MIVVDAGGPLVALAVFEDGLRHFEFVEFLRERKQRGLLRFDVSWIVEAVAEIDDGVERDEALRVEHGAHAIRDELMHALAFGADLHRAGEQLDDLILRELGLVGRGHRDFFERGAAGVERLNRRVLILPHGFKTFWKEALRSSRRISP